MPFESEAGTRAYCAQLASWLLKSPARSTHRLAIEQAAAAKARDDDARDFGPPEDDASARAAAAASHRRGVAVQWLIDFTNAKKCWDMPTWKVLTLWTACKHQVVFDSCCVPVVAPVHIQPARLRCRQVQLDVIKAHTAELHCHYVELDAVKSATVSSSGAAVVGPADV